MNSGIESLVGTNNLGKPHVIYVATNRQLLKDGINFAEARGKDVVFAKYTVSVPPKHIAGEVEWPKGKPDPATDFIVVDQKRLDRTKFGDELNTIAAAGGKKSNEAVVFVHGFNTSFAEGLFRFVQMVNDFEIAAIPVHYSWPSKGKVRAYVYDRDSVHIARDGFERTLDALANSDVQSITIVAHSMGGLLTVETLRQMSIRGNAKLAKKIKGIILISPDIDPDVFRAQVAQITPLPKPFVIFVSSKDKALRVSALLTGQDNRVGSLTSADQLDGLDITLIDLSNVEGGDGLRHMTAATSPSMIRLVSEIRKGGKSTAALTKTPQPVGGNLSVTRAGAAAKIVLSTVAN